MTLWKRIGCWLFAALLLTLVVAVILFFSIDRSIKIYPGIARDVFDQCRTLADVEAFLGGPPGDYTTVPYSFDPPDSTETPEQKEQRDKFIESFRHSGRRWITDDGCFMIAVGANGKILSSAQTKVYLSRQPNLLERVKKRFRLQYIPG